MSLQDYIAVKEKGARYLPHSASRYCAKRFKKAQCPIVERLVNSLMMHGRNNGKKLLTVRIVKHSFEIIHLTTGENPLQVRRISGVYLLHKIHFFLYPLSPSLVFSLRGNKWRIVFSPLYFIHFLPIPHVFLGFSQRYYLFSFPLTRISPPPLAGDSILNINPCRILVSNLLPCLLVLTAEHYFSF